MRNFFFFVISAVHVQCAQQTQIQIRPSLLSLRSSNENVFFLLFFMKKLFAEKSSEHLKKLKNQPFPLVRPSFVNFFQHLFNLFHEIVPLTRFMDMMYISPFLVYACIQNLLTDSDQIRQCHCCSWQFIRPSIPLVSSLSRPLVGFSSLHPSCSPHCPALLSSSLPLLLS